MKHCTNPDCPHRTRTGQPAEYTDRVEHCSDCGTALVAASLNASTSSPAAEAGWPRDLVRRLTVTVLCLLPVWLSSLVWMPFVRHDLLREMLHLDGLLIPQGVSLLAVGITPFISAFVLVELVALMVPQWRRRAAYVALFGTIRSSLDVRRRPDLVDVYFVGSPAWRLTRQAALRASARARGRPPP